MALDLGTELRDHLISAAPKDYGVAVLSFAHSAMSQTWHVWQEGAPGQVRIEDESLIDVMCVNVSVEIAGTESNLDQAFSIALDTTDIEDLFREELDRIPLDTTEYMRITYREYLASMLLDGPQAHVELDALSVSCQIGGAIIQAYAPRYNVSRTGDLYSPRDVPMLRGFL